MNTGTIIAEVLDDRDLFEGMQVAIYDPFKMAYVEISKLSHITKDQWVTNSGTQIKYDWELHEIVIVDGDTEAVLRDKDWKKGISMLNKNSAYQFNPAPFKEGHYHMECQRCHSHFEGSKSQGICLDCCIVLGKATLLTDKENKPQKVKEIKQKSIPLDQVEALLADAFDAGRYSGLEFGDWKSRQDL